MPEMSQAIYELSKVQAEVAQALIRAAHAAVDAIPDIDPDLLDEYAETPIEELLRGMLAAKEQADVDRDQAAADRTQVARLIALVSRLELASMVNAEGMTRLENGAAAVATDLAASQQRAGQGSGRCRCRR
jgi:hypothetical protein